MQMGSYWFTWYLQAKWVTVTGTSLTPWPVLSLASKKTHPKDDSHTQAHSSVWFLQTGHHSDALLRISESIFFFFYKKSFKSSLIISKGHPFTHLYLWHASQSTVTQPSDHKFWESQHRKLCKWPSQKARRLSISFWSCVTISVSKNIPLKCNAI